MQRTAKTIAIIVSASLLAAAVNMQAGEKAPDRVRVDLIYSSVEPGTTSAIVKARDGSPLVVSLVAYDPAGDKKPTLAEIVLRRRDQSQDSGNLFNPKGWHGVQKWGFAARTFVRGPKAAPYGDYRTIRVASVGLVFHVRVTGAGVKPFSTSALQSGSGYYFDYLKLEISVEKLAAK